MRTIKFRAWDIMGNWYYGLLSNPKVNTKSGVKKGHWYISNKGGMPFAYEIRSETIGQYTGLKDKNGRGQEVYEGDIIGSNGKVKGNIYQMDKEKTDFVIQGFGTKDWIKTYNEAVARGCKDAK